MKETRNYCEDESPGFEQHGAQIAHLQQSLLCLLVAQKPKNICVVSEHETSRNN